MPRPVPFALVGGLGDLRLGAAPGESQRVDPQPARPLGALVVAYRDFMRLRLPVLATSLASTQPAALRTKLTRAALLDLLAAAPGGTRVTADADSLNAWEVGFPYATTMGSTSKVPTI